MKDNTKEGLQYTTAILGFLSGIFLCVCSFFLNNYEITGSVLGYMGEMIAFCSAVFGLNLYMKGKWAEVRTETKEYVDEKLAEEHRHRDDPQFNNTEERNN